LENAVRNREIVKENIQKKCGTIKTKGYYLENMNRVLSELDYDLLTPKIGFKLDRMSLQHKSRSAKEIYNFLQDIFGASFVGETE
jgi:hypothetical protein